jgi:hypothetical protein
LPNSGAVYVYRRDGNSWSQEAFIKASNATNIDNFGTSAVVSGDTIAVGAYLEDSNQTTITNGATANADNSRQDSGAVYIFRNNERMFEPEIRVTGKTSTSITFAWNTNLGNTNQIKVAPVTSKSETPPVNCDSASALLLAPGTTSFTYTGLATGSTYTFRFCSWDGTSASTGLVFSATTL